MIEARVMENEVPSELLHVALVGPENNGKSVLTTTASGNKLILDFDQKRQAIAGRKNVYVLTLKDPAWPNQPQAVDEVTDIMSGLEKSLDLFQLRDKDGNRLFPEVPENTLVENLSFDSMQCFGKTVMRNELYHNSDLRRTLKVGSIDVQIPKNFDAWNAEMSVVEQIVMRAFALPINIFCVFHERPEETPDSTAEKPKFTGRVQLYPARYKDLLLKYFTDVWRVRLTSVASQNGSAFLPRVYVLPDYSHDSGTTMLLDAIEEPNIAAMIAKHKQRLSDGFVRNQPNEVETTGPRKLIKKN